MVVNGLEEYISVKCKHCVKSGPICPKPATSYVVDGRSFVTFIIRQTSWVFGGQWKEIKEIVEKFVLNILAEGCDVVFVMPHSESSPSSTELQNIKMGLEFVSINKRLPALDFFHNSPFAYFVFAQILRSCRVEVSCSISDFELEVSALASRRKDCAGIISNNNEFLAINTVPYCRLSSLDFAKHTIDTIDRFALTKNIGLKVNHLPLLTCLMGNALITPDMLFHFHKKLHMGLKASGNNAVLDIMPRLAMYARPQTTHYNMLARVALNNEDKTKLLEKVIKRYSLSEVTEDWKPYQPVEESQLAYNDRQIHEVSVSKQLSCESVPFLYSVLHDRLYVQGLTLEHEPLVTTFALYAPLRRACYDIVLGAGAQVTEKHIGQSLKIETVKTEEFLVKGAVLKLEHLRSTQKEALRWTAFVRCANVTFNQTLARQLPSQYLGLCCILNYWWHSPLIQLAPWELNAFLAQAVSQYAETTTNLRRILVSVVNTRAITLASQLARGAEALSQVSSVCHLTPDPLLLHNFFDGKLFSFYYYLADKGSTVEKLCDDMPDRIEMFKFLAMVIQSDNLSIEEEEVEIDEVVNVSIVPEYETISDEEGEGDTSNPQTEPALAFSQVSSVSDEYAMFEEAVSTKPKERESNGGSKEVPVEKSAFVRKDSTGGAVMDMIRLQMTTPDPTTAPKFPSFPTEEPTNHHERQSSSSDVFSAPEDPTYYRERQSSSSAVFPVSFPSGGNELAPPGLAPVVIPPQEEKSRIPLPPLPDQVPDWDLHHKDGPPPPRYKRHSDKENYRANVRGGGGAPHMYPAHPPEAGFGPPGEPPRPQVKRHKSGESYNEAYDFEFE